MLAALAISAVVLATAMMAMGSVMNLFHSNAQHYADDSMMKRTMTTLTSQLTDTTRMIYYASQNELRYQTGASYKALIHDPVSKKLILYDFAAGAAAQSKADLFADGSVSYPLNSAYYSNPIELANHVSSLLFTKEADGTALTSSPLGGGALVRFTITFDYLKKGMYGGERIHPRTESIVVKLLKDAL